MTGQPVSPDESLDLAADHLRSELRARVAGDPVTVAQIRESACAVVRLMRSTGVPPEKMLHAVKDLIQDGGLVPKGSVSRLTTGELDMLYPNMVTWCIQAYYDTEPDSPAPR